jgi:hypothetical protein
MPTATLLPALSQVEAIDTAYLRQAADYWQRTANLWEAAFTEVHERMSTPGGTPWNGQAAAAAQERSYIDMVKVRGPAYQLHEATGIARRGNEQLQACKAGVLEAVAEVRADGFDVGDDYSVTDRNRGGSPEFRAARLATAQGHAAFIRHRVAALVANDQEIATRIAAALEGIGNLTFAEVPGVDVPAKDSHSTGSGIHAVDHHTFKDAPNPPPNPPPGGWSSDPLMRAAQKIAYGHATGTSGHLVDFPGMTKDQLADLVHKMMQDSINNPKDLILGNSRSDGAPVIYDPKTNIVVIHDPTGAARKSDGGTVFKPGPGIDYIIGSPEKEVEPKIKDRVGSFAPDRLEDLPRSASPPAAPKPPVRAPVEAVPPIKPAPGIGEGSGLPKLPFGIGVPGDSPATGPHPIYPPHSIHQPPVLGEPSEEFD